MRSIVAMVLTLLVCAAVSEAHAQSPHRILGTWEMNVERSPDGPQRETRSYQQRQDGFFIYMRSTVSADGNPGFSQTAFKFDGKEYPIYTNGDLAQFLTTGTASPNNIGIFKAVDANTLEITVSELIRTFTVSPDGRTMTQRIMGTNPRGQSVNTVRVFDRVR